MARDFWPPSPGPNKPLRTLEPAWTPLVPGLGVEVREGQLSQAPPTLAFKLESLLLAHE